MQSLSHILSKLGPRIPFVCSFSLDTTPSIGFISLQTSGPRARVCKALKFLKAWQLASSSQPLKICTSLIRKADPSTLHYLSPRYMRLGAFQATNFWKFLTGGSSLSHCKNALRMICVHFSSWYSAQYLQLATAFLPWISQLEILDTILGTCRVIFVKFWHITWAISARS